MQALKQRSTGSKRRWPWLAILALVIVAAGGGAAYALTRGGHTTALTCGTGVSCGTATHGHTSHTGGATTASATTLLVRSFTPANGATGVSSNATLIVDFSGPVSAVGAMPTISPGVAGSWHTSGADKLVFTPTGPFVPYTKYTVTVPGGATGVTGVKGAHLTATSTASFTVANGSTTRLQELLAMLNFLPLSYTTPGAAPQDMALPQAGTMQWRWTTLPAALTDQWVQGSPNALTKGAIETFETQNNLTVDGVPGAQVWSALLADAASHKVDANPYTYVYVTKTLPEHLTAWVNGTLQFTNILVNTGVHGATTTDGTYQVFEHVRASDMKGTNVTGSTYNDPTVPWASYFNGGDALHGFPRAHYGYPQSNGCVEMQIATAGALWPYTPIGTLVTVVGPPT